MKFINALIGKPSKCVRTHAVILAFPNWMVWQIFVNFFATLFFVAISWVIEEVAERRKNKRVALASHAICQ